MFDVVIIGGGVAGLSAALVLGRARRRVLVCSAGPPRNAPAHAAYGFFSRDGVPPAELLRLGREQLAPYTSVELRDVAVRDVRGEAGAFEVVLDDGRLVRSRRILLATGVVDELPSVPGMRELWGSGVFHCPYCHGWEVRDQPLAVYGGDAAAVHLALLLRQWSGDIVLCTDGAPSFTTEERSRLVRHEVAIREEPILRIEGRDGRLEHIVFVTGDGISRRGVFVRAAQRQGSELPERLGYALANGFVQVDAQGQTTTPGVYAAGDMTSGYQQLSAAVADGARAAAMINGLDLLREEGA